jgi:hypothetical protein
MPYKIVHGTGKRPWKIIKKDTGRIVGTSKTKTMAMRSVKARYADEKKP